MKNTRYPTRPGTDKSYRFIIGNVFEKEKIPGNVSMEYNIPVDKRNSRKNDVNNY